MNALHNVVACGMVLYLGISDTPAWVVADANRYAIDHGKTPFVIYQGAWSVLDRDFERDIIPMARAEGMALAPFNVLAGGKVRTDAEEQNLFDIQIGDEDAKKLDEVSKDILRAELANGSFLSFCSLLLVVLFYTLYHIHPNSLLLLPLLAAMLDDVVIWPTNPRPYRPRKPKAPCPRLREAPRLG